MTLVERVKKLCSDQKITLAELERKTNLSNGVIRRWDEKTPGIDKLQKVADYFDVSTDYLLGRTNSKKIEDISKEGDIFKKFRDRPEIIEFVNELSDADKESLEQLRDIWRIMKKK